jgi:hypothetical protein
MRNRYKTLIAMAAFLMLFGAGIVVSAAETITPERLMLMEQQGLDIERQAGEHAPQGPGDLPILLDSLPNSDVLLIPNATDDYVAMFDPQDGQLLGTFITGHTGFNTPFCAIAGPDGNIYVSDQTADAVFVFDRQANFLYVYADASDTLDNIRGIDFRGDHLFVTTNARKIQEFDGPHSRIGAFIDDVNSSFDIFFLNDGRALLSNNSGNNVRLYNADGSFAQDLFSISFPEQINRDNADTNTYLSSSFTSGIINDFDIGGTIYQSTPWTNGRGIYRLGNGNYLATKSTGVFVIEPGTGAILQTVATGGWHFIELVSPFQGGDPAEIDIAPSSFVDTVQQGNSIDRQLYISNLGGSTLYYGIHDDSSWITASPDTGNVPSAFVDTAIVTFTAAALAPGTYMAQITVNSNDFDEPISVLPVTLVVEEPSSGCQYVAGDINGNGSANGIDVTFGVAFFKGGTPPPIDCNPPCVGVADPFYAAGDVNGNCAFNGIDITFYVAYLKGLQPALLFCQSCPPPARN